MEPEVWYSPPDECYLARCSDMPGIIGAGGTEAQALMELGVARLGATEAKAEQIVISEDDFKVLARMGVEALPLSDYVFIVTDDIWIGGAVIPIGTVGVVTNNRVVFEPDRILPVGQRVPGFSIPSLVLWDEHLRAVYLRIGVDLNF